MPDQPDNQPAEDADDLDTDLDTDPDADAASSVEALTDETFDADYVKKLRSEAAKHRQRATDAEAQLGELKRFGCSPSEGRNDGLVTGVFLIKST